MRLIDADSMIANGLKNKSIEVRTEDIIDNYEKVIKLLFKDLLAFIREQPTVDAVEIVRCKDCKHYRPIGRVTGICAINDIEHRLFADWFCADGERRSE